MLRRPAPALALLLLTDCAAGMAQQPGPAAGPADPAAQEAPLPPAPNLLQGDSTVSLAATAPAAPPSPQAAHQPEGMTGPHRHHHGGTPAADYTCVMHPEVHDNKPGKCPRCGMKLVPQGEPDGGDKR